MSTISEKYNIIELHPGECRSGSQIKKKIGEACSSRRIHLKSENLFRQKSFRSPKPLNRINLMDDCKRKKDTNEMNSSTKGSLILIEHPEIFCDEDVNMASSMTQLFRRSKIPIVITTNDLLFVEDVLDLPESAKVIKCERPSLTYCTYRVLLALCVTMMNTKTKIKYSIPNENVVIAIEQLLMENSCDLRKVLAHVSSFAEIRCKENFANKKITNGSQQYMGDLCPPIIQKIMPNILPICGGNARIYYTCPSNICHVYINGERSSFKVSQIDNFVEVKVPPCPHGKASCNEDKHKTQLDEYFGAMTKSDYSRRFSEVVLISSNNGILSRSDWLPSSNLIENARNLTPDTFLKHRRWNILYDTDESNAKESPLDISDQEDVDVLNWTSKIHDIRQIDQEFQKILNLSDEVIITDSVQMGG